MNGKTWNHASAESRKSHGLPIEKQFAKKFVCQCGGKFRRAVRYWEADLQCEDCGQLVEIKSSPQTARTGNIAISARAWHHYSEDILVVTNVSGTWLGSVKTDIEEICDCIHDALGSTHKDTGGYGGGAYDSSFYLIPVRSLQVLE